MLTDEWLVKEQPHPSEIIGGVQRIYRFPNGFGLSAVNGSRLHVYPFAWEIAVLKGVKEDGSGWAELTYETRLTNDVEVFITDDEANNFIRRAAKEIGDIQE